jgi:methyl-accepting chemotaxis protein
MSKKRKNTMIKKRFQNELIVKSVLTTFITFNIILVCAYLMTDSLFASALSVQTFLQYIAGLELIAAVVIYMISRHFSFHIAGPVYAFERSLKAMAGGDLTFSLQIRKNDNFGEVSNMLNEMLGIYREQITAIKLQVNEVKSKAESNSSLTSEFDDLEQKLNFFRIEKGESEDYA